MKIYVWHCGVSQCCGWYPPEGIEMVDPNVSDPGPEYAEWEEVDPEAYYEWDAHKDDPPEYWWRVEYGEPRGVAYDSWFLFVRGEGA